MARYLRIAGILLCLTGMAGIIACAPQDSELDNLARKISRNVTIPGTAYSPEEYSQYYLMGADNVVEAVFIRRPAGLREFVERECKRLGERSFPCDQPDYGVVEPGARKWVERRDHLPGVSDGGCSYVHIRYDADADQFLSVECGDFY